MRKRKPREASSRHYLRGYLYVIKGGTRMDRSARTTVYVKSRGGSGRPRWQVQWESRSNHLAFSVTRYPKK